MQSMSDVVSRSIVLTLSYSSVFLQPLTTTEIHRRLIYSKNRKKIVKLDEIKKALLELSAKNIVKKSGQYWQLSLHSPSLVEKRRKRERVSKLKLRELAPLIRFAKKISWITGVAITGSVSVQNAEAKDDVDLMIVVQPRRLWLVRPLLVFFSFLHGKRRSWNHEEHNSWCLNLWLEESAVQMPAHKRSLYIAYEVCQAEWVINKNDMAEIFLVTNIWVQRYLPEFFKWRLMTMGYSLPAVKLNRREIEITADFWDWVNSLAYKLQRWYMHRHMTRERVDKEYAFFHPRDTRRNIMRDWQREIERLIRVVGS